MKRLLISFILILLVFRVSGQDVSGYWGAGVNSESGVSVGVIFHFKENSSVDVIIATSYMTTDGKERQLSGTVYGYYSIEDDVISVSLETKSVNFGSATSKLYTQALYESFWAFVATLPSESTFKFQEEGDFPILESEEWGQFRKLNNNTDAQAAVQEESQRSPASQTGAQKDGVEKTEAEQLAAQQEESRLATARTEEERLAAEKMVVTTEVAEAERPTVEKTEQARNTIEKQADIVPINSDRFVRRGSKLYFADSGQLVSSTDFRDNTAWQLYEKGSSQVNARNYCFITSGVGLGLCATGFALMQGESDSAYTMGMVGFVAGMVITPISAIAGVILGLNGKEKIEKAIRMETSGYSSTVSFGLQQNGMGIALNF